MVLSSFQVLPAMFPKEFMEPHAIFSRNKSGPFVFPVGPTKTIIESSSHSRHVFFRVRTMKRFSAAGEIND